MMMLPKLLAAFYFYNKLVLLNLRDTKSVIKEIGEKILSVISTSEPTADKLLKEISINLPPLLMKLYKPLLKAVICLRVILY